MNTDKLMELERRWRAEANSLRDQCLQLSEPSYLHREAAKIDERADELAALRAEQAVGGDGRLPCPFGDACVGRDCNRCGNFTPAKPKAHEVKAVGEEQRARELLAEEIDQDPAAATPKAVSAMREGKPAGVATISTALRAIRRALGTARPNDLDAVVAQRDALAGKLAWLEESVRNAGCEIDYSATQGEGGEDCVWNRRAEDAETARQSEGVVRAPAIRLHDSWRGTADRLDKWSKLPENKKSLLGQTMEEAAHFIRHYLAAAPGGEGEG